MSKRSAQLLGVGILILGIVAALPFRRKTRGQLASNPSTQPELQLQQADSPSSPVRDTSATKLIEATTASPLAAPHPLAVSPITNEANSPLAVSPITNETSAPTSSMRPVKAVEKVPSLAEKYPPLAMVPRRPAPVLSADEKPRKHTLVDGDTLPDLAERYLGSRERYQEILQANPQLRLGLLPLRRVIRIPPKFSPTVELRRPRTKLVPVD